jgi:choline kinase
VAGPHRLTSDSHRRRAEVEVRAEHGIVKAFILAAGRGSRMHPLAQDRPKSLLTIENETILGRQLRILRSCGIADITVVTGFEQDKIRDTFADDNRIVYNPDYDSTNSVISLWMAREFMTEGFVALNADVIFTEKSIKRLLADRNTYSLLVDKNTCDAEDMKVTISRGTIVGISKTLPVEEAYGAFVQVAKINWEGVAMFRDALCDCADRNPQAWWPVAFALLAGRGHKIGFVDAQDPWIEVDTPEDYALARRLFVARDGNPGTDPS